jgi:hypothetical protein
MAGLENPLRVESGLVDLSPEAHQPEGLHIARTLIRQRWELPMRVLNATCDDQKLTIGSTLAHCRQVTLVTPTDVEQPQVQDTALKLQDVIVAAKPNLLDAESQELDRQYTTV